MSKDIWDEAPKLADKILSSMTDDEILELVEDSFGMWHDYPKDWLMKLREGKLQLVSTPLQKPDPYLSILGISEEEL